MNLHAIVGPIISAVNPSIVVTLRASTGYSTNADGSRVPSYAPPINVLVQMQPETFRDIQQLDGLNLQGDRRVIYINGYVDGLVRKSARGGDLLTIGCEVWLVAQVLEDFYVTAGWTKAAITLQNDG